MRGWDDPRMPTICGLRRRGYTPEAIRLFCERIGVAKFNSTIDMDVLEELRARRSERAGRAADGGAAAAEGGDRQLSGRASRGARGGEQSGRPGGRHAARCRSRASCTSSRMIFAKMPPKKFFRLVPGGEVRLRYAYFIKCDGVVKDAATGEVTEVHCTYDPERRAACRKPNGR